MKRRKPRKDRLEPWRRQVRIERSRERYRRRRAATGRCRYCSDPTPVSGPGDQCEPCRVRRNLGEVERYRRQQRRQRQHGLPTAKQTPALVLLAAGSTWNLAAFAAARYPGRDPFAAQGVAMKVLKNMMDRGLVKKIRKPGHFVYAVTEHGKQALVAVVDYGQFKDRMDGCNLEPGDRVPEG